LFSAQSASENESTNAFVAPYTAMYGTGWNAAVEATLITPPRPRATMFGKNACVISTRPEQFNMISSCCRASDTASNAP